MKILRFLGLTLLVIGCSAEREVVEVDVPDSDCSVRFVARHAHPFLAEFERSLEVTCGSGHETLSLEMDSGGLGRVELSRDDTLLVIADAFAVVRIRLADGAISSRETDPGKVEFYDSKCGREPVFEGTKENFLGAFDYCDHRWQYLESR